MPTDVRSNFNSGPPKARFGQRLLHRKRNLKSPRISDDVDKFGERLGNDSQGNLTVKDLPAQEFACGVMSRQLDQLQLH